MKNVRSDPIVTLVLFILYLRNELMCLLGFHHWNYRAPDVDSVQRQCTWCKIKQYWIYGAELLRGHWESW